MSLPVFPPVIESMAENDGKPRNYNENYIFYWNNVALDLVRLTHTNGGHQNGPPLTARFLGIFHLAMHDAYFDVFPYSTHPNFMSEFADDFEPYLPKSDRNENKLSTLSRNAAGAKEAVGGAAVTVLNKLFRNPDKRDGGVSQKTLAALGDYIDQSVRTYRQVYHVTLHSPAYNHGVEIAKLILRKLETRAREDGVDAGGYAPNADQPYWFDDDPSHPTRMQSIDPNDPEDGDRVVRPYHAPYYARTAAVLATTRDIKIADPPVVPSNPPNPDESPSPEHLKYLESLEDVHRMGGAEELATTKRRPTQTARGLFWAYDGVNLIGTPPRLYNQIVKQIAFDKKAEGQLTSDENNAQFIRLLALVNVAMADAGIFCWRDKYKYELWRPLTGVRADPTGPVPDGHSRPTWRVLGAPNTNSNMGGFKPPFPAYPSGHATFGAAAFQMVRLFYHQRGDMVLQNVERGAAKSQSTKTETDPEEIEKQTEGKRTEGKKVDDKKADDKKAVAEGKSSGSESKAPKTTVLKKPEQQNTSSDGTLPIPSEVERIDSHGPEIPMSDPHSKSDQGTKKATNERTKDATKRATNEDSDPTKQVSTEKKLDQRSANDKISFTFISDELNGISRTLSQPYNPSMPIQNQSGDIRTRVPIKFSSLKEAIFSNAMSRIWLGVHWHFDAFAGETVCEGYTEGSELGRDNNLPRPTEYEQLFKVDKDGSTMYKDVKKMDWFDKESMGPRTGCGKDERFPVGGVPMGIMIADDIFANKMRLVNCLNRSGDTSSEHFYCTPFL